jgi:hypothetical protein
MSSWAGRAIGIALVVGIVPAADAESARTMQSARERATETAPGPWQGNWSLLRDDERIRTRAGGETLRLHVIDDAAGPVEVQWVADRGICEDPSAPPCEWVGSSGPAATARAVPGALAVLLRISADADDPFLLVLERREDGRAAARLVSEKGDIAYRLDAERE